MRRRPAAAALVASLVLLVLTSGGLGWLTWERPSEPAATRPAPDPTPAAVLDALASLPLGFEPNVGQAEAGVRYVARGPGYRLALSPTEATVDLPEADGPLRMRLVGSNPAAAITGADPLPGHTNYLTGNDPSGWRADVPTFARVSYNDVWPGVDLVFLGDRRRLRHDFVVAPGADPAAIAVEFPAVPATITATITAGANDEPAVPAAVTATITAGANDEPAVTVDPATGDLLVGATRLSAPVLFQDVDGDRRPVEGAFRLLGGTRVGFTVGTYDRSRPLVIDPTLVTSSYLGGSGNDLAAAVDIDGGGNVYIVGSTESTDFKATNPVQNTLNGDGSAGKSDAFVAKLNPEGTTLVFATYLGGTGRDTAAGVAVGADGSVYVTGVTESDNFPKTSPAFQETYGGGPSDAFVSRLNAAGSSLGYSTFLGGPQTDAARAVAVSPDGEAFVTGSTNSVEFPTANPFQQAAPRVDDVDAFVTKVAADGATLGFSTRLGGDSDDRGLDIAVDATGIYVTGDTRSPGFPTARPLQPGAGGSETGVAGSFADAFVSKFGPAGSNLVYSTFLGGSDTDQGAAITVDVEGAAYVTGTTNSPNFPIETALQARKDADTDAFVSKVNAAGSKLDYSTYLGGSGADGGTGIVVDRLGSVTVVGTTGSSNFPTAKPIQGVKAGGATDGFVSTLAPAGATLVSSTYLGGREDDQATAVAIGPGAATPVVVGSTTSADFPTAKPLQPARAGAPTDAFVTRVSGADAESPATSAASGGGVAAPATTATSGTHDKRVRLLVATTAGLFLVAVLQTAYLRRKSATETAHWGSEQPEPLVPPPPVQTWGGGVRLIEDEAHDDVFADLADDNQSGEMTVVGGADLAVPDLLDEDWVAEVTPPAAVRTAPPAAPITSPPLPRVPLEELSFWDLFPEDLPPSRRPGAIDDADWALEDQEDVLVGPGPQGPPLLPPLPAPPPMPGPWGDVDRVPAAEPPPAAPSSPGSGRAEPEAPDDNLLLTELLDLSPAATQAANAAHYGNLIEAGGGDVGGRFDDDQDDDQDVQYELDDEADGREGGGPAGAGDGTVRKSTGPVRSGSSGSGSGSSGSGSSGSGKRKPRPKRSGRRRPKPDGGPTGSGGTGGTGGSGGTGTGGSGSGGGAGAGNLGG